MKCIQCGKEGTHYCVAEGRTLSESSDGDLFISAVVGAVTDNAIIGGLLGGSLLGGIVGDVLKDGELF